MAKDLTLRSCLSGSAIVIVAIAVRAGLDFIVPGTPPFIILYPAVALVGLLCGPLAGVAASILGVLAAIYLWIPPQPGVTDRVSIGLFTTASAIVLWAAAALRAQLEAVSVARQALDLGLAVGGIGTWEINLRTRCITASDTAYRLHGLSEKAGRTDVGDWIATIDPNDLESVRATVQAAIADDIPAFYTYRVVGPTGGPRWISGHCRLVSSSGERRLLAALVEITDQVRVQEDLKRERARLRLALEAASLAVWEYDLETGEATVDMRYAVTLGLDPDISTLTRSQIGAHIHPEDRPRVSAEHEALVARGRDYHIEYRILTRTGDVRWVVSQGLPARGDAPGDRGRFVGVIRDITDRKLREESLRELAETREVLIREADHRIKNSLQLVMSLLSVQLRGVADPRAADALRGAITRVGAIAASHLALQSSADLKSVDLAVTLRDLCGHFAQLHPSVTIICRPGEALMLDADRAIPIGLVVSELLTNALRHAFVGRDTGTIVVEAETDAGALIVRVGDDGVGMPPQTGEGGLGSRIITALTGQISATIATESTPASGTITTLRLPLRCAEADTALA